MPTRRQRRLNELLFEEISLLVPGRVSDPRLTDVTITRVETTQDLSTAKVYFTLADASARHEAAIEGLKHCEGFLRAELADVGLRRLPHLVFARDKDFESGERVLEILEQLRHEDGIGHEGGAESLDESGGSAAPGGLTESGGSAALGGLTESGGSAAPGDEGEPRPREDHGVAGGR